MLFGVIMAGGKGERFWPLSRAHRPKQFLKLTSERTMLDETIERVRPLIPLDNIRIVTGQSMTNLIIENNRSITEKHILTEPVARNTCLAIGLAAVHLQKQDKDAVMVVLSADHLIRPAEKLLEILTDASAAAAKEDKLITIGIVPTRPDTGYGYIRLGEQQNFAGNSTMHQVAAFVEKPKAALAQEYYFSRRYLWNSGMFVWSAKSILKAIDECQPEIGKSLKDYSKAIGTASEETARAKLYENTISISIDYAVLEKASNVLVVKADILWDDVGSWTSLERYKEQDSSHNVIVGEAVTFDTYETTIFNDASGIVAAVGLADVVIVRSADITLVAHKTKVGLIKDLLGKLNNDEKNKKYL